MGGGGGPELSQEQRQLFNIIGETGQIASAQEQVRFRQAQQDAARARGLIPGLTNQVQQARGLNNNLTNRALVEGNQRLAQEDARLGVAGRAANDLFNIGRGFTPQATNVLNQSSLAQRNLAGQALNTSAPQALGNIGNFASGQGRLDVNRLAPNEFAALQSIAGQFRGPGSVPSLNEIGNRAVAQSARSAQAINPNIGQLQAIGGRALGQANNIQNELAPLRQGSLSQLNQVLQGEIPGAIQSLITPGGESSERAILEAQFDVANRNTLESGGQRGAGLSRNLASLQGQRALSLAEAGARRDEAQRQAALGLYNQALQQGLTARGQTQEALQLGGSLFEAAGGQQLGAEQLRQGALGLGAQAFGTAGQQRLAGLQGAASTAQAGLQGRLAGQDLRNQQLALGLQGIGAGEQARQSAIGLGAQLYQQAGQADLASSQNQLAQQALRGQLTQAGLQGQLALAGQLGQGADNLLFGVAPGLAQRNIEGQALLGQQQALPSSILSGIQLSPASSYFSSAAGLLGPPTSGPNGNAALGSALGGIAGGVLGGIYGGPGGATAGYGAGSGVGGALGGLF